MKTIAFIGFGLIGGSIAKGLKKKDPALRIMAYARNVSNLEVAQEDGIVNIVLESPASEKLSEADVIFLCAPVESNIAYMPEIAKRMKEGAVLTDVGSTKTAVCEKAKELGLEGCFVGGHPMAGSEQTGYKAATDYLFSNAYYIITPISEEHPELTAVLTEIAETLQAIPIVVDARTHDDAVAAVSHLPHIVASSLVNLVKDSDDESQLMKTIAAGGFRDITRIASSSPEMWEQICDTNAVPLTEILDRYIAELQDISNSLKKPESDRKILHMFESSREYRNSISAKNKGTLTPDYSFSVDVADEVGAISTISVILASKGISIKNIGINNARDHGEGALRISFYQEEAEEQAIAVLKRYQYDVRL